MAVPITAISALSRVATGINVFTLPLERQAALLETLHAINHEILLHKFPMNVSSNFHRALDAPVIINYNQYTDRASGQYLRTRPETAPLLKRTHDLSDKHEIRWYEVEEVVTANGVNDRIEVSDAPDRKAAIGIFTVEPSRRREFLALLKHYGETLVGDKARGFIGLAVHRGYDDAQAATYEQWIDADAYRQATQHGRAASVLEEVRAAANDTHILLYEVLTVTRFDLGA
jgi:quinol monooxygenase YgiN